jgi:hypothetical protein
MKNHLLKLLLISSPLAFTQAQAETKCVELFKQTSKRLPQSVDEIQRFQTSLFKEWNPRLGKYAVRDVKVVVDPSITYLDSGYSYPLNNITLGMPLKNQSVEILQYVQGHEYGHAIFGSHFTFKLGDQVYKFQDLIKKAKKEKQPGQATEELGFFQGALDYYIEFFSDNIAVLLYRDPYTMAQIHPDVSKLEASDTKRILMGYKKQRPKGAPPPRAFVAFPYKLWKVPLYDPYRTSSPLFDPYAVLDPVRGDLWNLYLKNLPDAEIPLYIDVLLKTIADHVQAQSAIGEWPPSYSVPSAQTLDEVNAGFLKIFKENAEKLGLLVRED